MNAATPKRQLTLFDSTCIIVGIIIGAGIYESTPRIAQCVASPWMLLGAFALGGLISFIGALCYAELATTYPRDGGEYVFLTRAYGRRTGFLFAWSEFWIVRPGSIGAMAYIFASYASELLASSGMRPNLMVLALISVLLITAINVLGVQSGKWAQNVLTTVKVLGLLAVFAVGLWITVENAPAQQEIKAPREGGFRLAMILVLFAYGGWNEISYVAAEVRSPSRNILRALIFGTLLVTSIYLAVNIAFVGALGFQGVRDSGALASEVVHILLGNWGSAAISLLICISCLGAINGMIFTGARVYYALGVEHRVYAWLGKWNEQLEIPLRALVLQSVVSMLLIAVFYFSSKPRESFEGLVAFTAPFFWGFFLLVAVSIFVLRYKDRDVARPFRATLYPMTPILFCLSSLFMLYSAVTYAAFVYANDQEIGLVPWYLHFKSLWPVGMMLIGFGLSFLDPRDEV